MLSRCIYRQTLSTTSRSTAVTVDKETVTTRTYFGVSSSVSNAYIESCRRSSNFSSPRHVDPLSSRYFSTSSSIHVQAVRSKTQTLSFPLEDVFEAQSIPFPDREEHFEIGLTLCITDLARIKGQIGRQFSREAAQWLLDEDLRVRRFLAFLSEGGVTQLAGVRIAIIGPEVDITTAPWLCRRGLITTRMRNQGDVLIQMPLSFAITPPSLPLSPFTSSVASGHLSALVERVHVLPGHAKALLPHWALASLISSASALDADVAIPPEGPSFASLAEYMLSLRPYLDMLPSNPISPYTFPLTIAPLHIPRTSSPLFSPDITDALRTGTSPAMLSLAQPHLPVTDILIPLTFFWCLNWTPRETGPARSSVTGLPPRGAPTPVWQQLAYERASRTKVPPVWEHSQQHARSYAGSDHDSRMGRRTSLLVGYDQQYQLPVPSRFFTGVPPSTLLSTAVGRRVRSSSSSLATLLDGLGATGGLATAAGANNDASLGRCLQVSVTHPPALVASTPLTHEAATRQLAHVVTRTLTLPARVLPFATHINVEGASVKPYDRSGGSPLCMRYPSAASEMAPVLPCGVVNEGQQDNVMLLPYIDLANHALSARAHNVSLAFTSEWDEDAYDGKYDAESGQYQGGDQREGAGPEGWMAADADTDAAHSAPQMTTYVNLVARRHLQPHEELCLAYHRLDDAGTGSEPPAHCGDAPALEATADYSWGGLGGTASEGADVRLAKQLELTDDQWMQESPSELLVRYGLGVVDTELGETRVSVRELVQRLERMRDGVLAWKNAHEERTSAPVNVAFEFNDVCGWRRVALKVGAPRMFLTDQEHGVESHQRDVLWTFNTHIATEADDSALVLLSQLGHPLANATLPLVGRRGDMEGAAATYLHAAEAVLAQLHPDLMDEQPVSADVRHSSSPAAWTALQSAATHFIACCLLLDVGHAMWGPSIPGVNVNLVRAIDTLPQMGSELASPAELLMGALPSPSNVTNAWKNKDREDREALRMSHRRASEIAMRIRNEVEDRPEREQQRLSMLQAMEDVNTQLEALDAVMHLRGDYVLMWQYMYTSMHRSFGKAVETYQDSI